MSHLPLLWYFFVLCFLILDLKNMEKDFWIFENCASLPQTYYKNCVFLHVFWYSSANIKVAQKNFLEPLWEGFSTSEIQNFKIVTA